VPGRRGIGRGECMRSNVVTGQDAQSGLPPYGATERTVHMGRGEAPGPRVLGHIAAPGWFIEALAKSQLRVNVESHCRRAAQGWRSSDRAEIAGSRKERRPTFGSRWMATAGSPRRNTTTVLGQPVFGYLVFPGRYPVRRGSVITTQRRTCS